MQANPFLGLFFHAIGGLAAASFYIPYKKVKKWNWETYWLVGGFFSWIIAPWLLAIIIVPQTPNILASVPFKTMLTTCLFGVMWGVGGLTFGLTMRYLGIALGYAIALGLCAAFGTLMPPLFSGELAAMAHTISGQVILLGVFVCLTGIALSGKAGISKEKELSDKQKKESIGEFNFIKGLIVAIISGIMSAAMAYGFAAGKPIAQIALQNNVPDIWQNLPVLIIVLFGGFVTNCVGCLYLILKNKRTKDFFALPLENENASLSVNYLLCALAGVTWYMQFFFYGMGTTKMGKYDFSSWTLHMASIIIFGTMWGISLKEWAGTSRTTKSWIAAGLTVLIISMIVIGIGTKMEAANP
jgi:L-rhamnose-H+ transport protein